MKYLRKQADGSVYLFNEILAARPDMDTFECRDAPPEVIPNLGEFLTEQAAATKSRRAKSQDVEA